MKVEYNIEFYDIFLLSHFNADDGIIHNYLPPSEANKLKMGNKINEKIYIHISAFFLSRKSIHYFYSQNQSYS